MTRIDALLAAVLFVALLTAGSLRLVPGVVGVFHDDAIYAVTARSLAEGDGYRLVNLPGAPAQTKYPILYPAVMAAVSSTARTLDAQLAAMQVATFVLAALALAATYLYLVRFGYSARLPAFAGCLLCTSAPNYLFYCVQVLTELPFALLLVAALWVTERFRGSAAPPAPARELLIGVALGIPALCRIVGIVLPLAALAVFATERRRVRYVALGAALPIVPWLVWTAGAVGATAEAPVLGYQTDYLGWWTWTDLALSAGLVVSNVAQALRAFTQISFEPTARWLYGVTPAAAPLLMLAGGLVPALALLWRCRRPALLYWTLAAYAAIVLLWPWPPDRFLVPVLPLLAAFFFDVVQRAAAPLGSRGAALAVVTILAMGLATNAALLSRVASASDEHGYPFFVSADDPVNWRSYENAFAWLNENTGADEVLAAGFDSMTALYTGRPTIRPYVARPAAIYYGHDLPPLGTPEELGAIFDRYRPRYLLLAPMPAYAEEAAYYDLVNAFGERSPERLRLVWVDDDPRFGIYEIVAKE